MSLCLDYDPDRRATCTELMRCEHFESFASEFRDEFKASLALDDSEFAMKRKRSKKRDRGNATAMTVAVEVGKGAESRKQSR